MSECFDTLIVDVDGVVWRDGEPIEGNVRGLRRAAEAGARIVFLTNNSTRSRRSYALTLSKATGLRVGVEDVVNSGYSAAQWLARERGPSRVLVVGEEGLAEELVLAGHSLLVPSDWRHADAVVVGLDRSLTYRVLAAAHRAITSGAIFLATNRDPSYPVRDGTEPGAGSIVALLEASTGRKPDFDAGKPGGWILSLALERSGPRPLVVGDRLDTDGEMAARAGLPFLLVLTGVTRNPPPGVPAAGSLEEALSRGLLRPCRD